MVSFANVMELSRFSPNISVLPKQQGHAFLSHRTNIHVAAWLITMSDPDYAIMLVIGTCLNLARGTDYVFVSGRATTLLALAIVSSTNKVTPHSYAIRVSPTKHSGTGRGVPSTDASRTHSARHLADRSPVQVSFIHSAILRKHVVDDHATTHVIYQVSRGASISAEDCWKLCLALSTSFTTAAIAISRSFEIYLQYRSESHAIPPS
jgi:hypothetical protein